MEHLRSQIYLTSVLFLQWIKELSGKEFKSHNLMGFCSEYVKQQEK